MTLGMQTCGGKARGAGLMLASAGLMLAAGGTGIAVRPGRGPLLDPEAGGSAGGEGGSDAGGTVTMSQRELDDMITARAAQAAKQALIEAEKARADEAAAQRAGQLHLLRTAFAGTSGVEEAIKAAQSDSNVRIEDVREQLTKAAIAQAVPATSLIVPVDGPAAAIARISVGATAEDKHKHAIGLSLLVKGSPMITQMLEGAGNDPDGRAAQRLARALGYDSPSAAMKDIREMQSSGLHTYSMVEQAQMLMNSEGRARWSRGGDRQQRFMMATSVGTSSFAGVFENVANKTMQASYVLQTSTFEDFCQIGNAVDFRDASEVTLSNFGMLKETPEFGKPEFIYNSDRRVTIKPTKFTGTFGWSIESAYNDDMGALMQLPRLAGIAAAVAPEAAVYRLLSVGHSTNFQGDGVPVFAAARGNLAGAGGALTPATTEAAYQAFGEARDFGPNRMAIAIVPDRVIVPPALWGAAERVYTSVKDYSAAPAVAGDKPDNIMKGRLRPLMSPYLAATYGGSDAAWYVASTSAVKRAIKVNFLDGQRIPRIERLAQSDTMTVQRWEIMLAFGLNWTAPEVIYRNPGA